jgi:hypothetical protein
MQLELTDLQAAELWTILALRVDQLEREIDTHPIDDVRAISRRQLARTMPIYKALNDYATLTA